MVLDREAKRGHRAKRGNQNLSDSWRSSWSQEVPLEGTDDIRNKHGLYSSAMRASLMNSVGVMRSGCMCQEMEVAFGSLISCGDRLSLSPIAIS